MIWLYRLLYLPGLLLTFPYYFLRMRRRGGYKKDFQHRFGRFHRLPPTADGKTRYWLQAVSVGEVLAIGPLIDAWSQDGEIEIVLTTTTSTGYTEAKKRYAGKVLSIGIFPLDFWLFSRIAWRRINPDAIILTESELWPEHLHRAARRQVPAYLVNARISDKSFGRYILVPHLTHRLLVKFSRIYAASETDRTRLERLGADRNTLHYFGSIKLDVPPPAAMSNAEKLELLLSLGFVSDDTKPPFVILGSSTWPGEEAALINIINRLAKSEHDCRLLLVPRHAERAPEIVTELKKQALTWHQRSTGVAAKKNIRIYLADTTGELSMLTQIADLAFIGKSLEPNIGGQSPIDAAGLGVPILMGPNMNNFRDISNTLFNEGAATAVYDEMSLEAAIQNLIQNRSIWKNMAESGKSWHAESQGSSKRIAQAITDSFNRSDANEFL